MSSADRSRRYRERVKTGATWQPPSCQACGANCSGRHGVLCVRCWERLTPEGRAAKSARVQLSKARRRAAGNV